MSLWTPGGEHPVDRPQPSEPAGPPPSAAGGPSPGLDDLSPEERAAAEEYARELDQMRRQLLELPAGVVVGQHALQFFDVRGSTCPSPRPGSRTPGSPSTPWPR
ncbi:MAG TPA: hypothetical protein VFB77_11010 [Acidimicrobiales bacterium]|nr:hypothetical protein [Acidimicrobiales bacterium]